MPASGWNAHICNAPSKHKSVDFFAIADFAGAGGVEPTSAAQADSPGAGRSHASAAAALIALAEDLLDSVLLRTTLRNGLAHPHGPVAPDGLDPFADHPLVLGIVDEGADRFQFVEELQLLQDTEEVILSW